MGVNSLPKTVTRQRRGCGLNSGPSAPEFTTLTTRLPSHPECTARPNKQHMIRRSSDEVEYEESVAARIHVSHSTWLVKSPTDTTNNCHNDLLRSRAVRNVPRLLGILMCAASETGPGCR